MIVFNFFAIGQAIIVVAIVALLHWILNLIGFDIDLIGGTYEAPYSLMFGAYICAATELRGMKGRLFWLPMWLLLIAGSLFVIFINQKSGRFSWDGIELKNRLMDYYPLLYVVGAYIFYYFYKNLNKYMMQRWEASKTALAQLKQLDYKEIDKKEFWGFINMSYFKPSPIYYHLNEVWSKIYKNSVPEKEYITHTTDLLGVLNEYGVEQKRHKKWIETFYNETVGAEKLNNFNPPFMGFKRLEECISQNS